MAALIGLILAALGIGVLMARSHRTAQVIAFPEQPAPILSTDEPLPPLTSLAPLAPLDPFETLPPLTASEPITEIMQTPITNPEPPAAPEPSLNDLFQYYGKRYGVDWKLLKAIATVESSLNASAVNMADNESIGLMQILCRPDGRGGCANRLNLPEWSGITRAALFVPAKNIEIGAALLAANIRQYGYPRAVAVYNAFDQHTAPIGGPFKNQAYVDKVLRTYKSLGG